MYEYISSAKKNSEFLQIIRCHGRLPTTTISVTATRSSSSSSQPSLHDVIRGARDSPKSFFLLENRSLKASLKKREKRPRGRQGSVGITSSRDDRRRSGELCCKTTGVLSSASEGSLLSRRRRRLILPPFAFSFLTNRRERPLTFSTSPSLPPLPLLTPKGERTVWDSPKAKSRMLERLIPPVG